MKLLDFSTGKFDSLDDSLPWEKEISDFLKDWNSESDQIIAQTSGSTGTPKKIILTKSAMRLSARLTGEFFDLTSGKSALLCLPVSFIAGKMMIVRAIELGLKLYISMPSTKIEWDSDLNVDFVPFTPLQVENSKDSLPKIKTLLIGGAPLSENLRSELLEINSNAFESYGMTETITHIALKKISEEFFQVLPQIKIRKDLQNCLVIQTPYFTEEIFTNDIVELKGNSKFKWLGRLDSVINSGGIKLIPEQIESKLKSFINQEFIVSSLPDASLSEKLILIIESPLPFDLSFEEIPLSKFEIPKSVYFLPNFPRTESGKLQRNLIREEVLKNFQH